MAWVDDLEVREGTGRLQPTHVIARVKIFRMPDDRPIVQIDTYGSEDRDHPGKQSQTLQFGEEAASKLYALLQRTYGFESR